jgi:hypothetical protein
VCRRYHVFTAGSVEDELRVVSETAKLHVAARHGNDNSNTYIYRADRTASDRRQERKQGVSLSIAKSLATAEPCRRNLTLTLRVPPSTICLLLRAACPGELASARAAQEVGGDDSRPLTSASRRLPDDGVGHGLSAARKRIGK